MRLPIPSRTPMILALAAGAAASLLAAAPAGAASTAQPPGWPPFSYNCMDTFTPAPVDVIGRDCWAGDDTPTGGDVFRIPVRISNVRTHESWICTEVQVRDYPKLIVGHNCLRDQQ